MAIVGGVIQAVRPFKSLFKLTRVEKREPGPKNHQVHGLFAGLESDQEKNTGKR